MSKGIDIVLTSILGYISHLGSLQIKTTKNIHDVRQLVQWGVVKPYPIWLSLGVRNWWVLKEGFLTRISVDKHSKHPRTTPQGPTRVPWGRPLHWVECCARNCAPTTCHQRIVFQLMGHWFPPSKETYYIWQKPVLTSLSTLGRTNNTVGPLAIIW